MLNSKKKTKLFFTPDLSFKTVALDHHPVLYFFFQPTLLSAIQAQGTTVLVMVLFVLLFLSFVLSGSEVAFFSLTYKDINNLKSKQQLPYKRIVDLLEEPKVLLASLLIANSFINISIIIISNLLIDNMFNFEQVDAAWVEFLIKVIAVSFLLVLFGEVMPKVLATQNNIRFAKDFGGIVQGISYLCKGLSKGLVKYSDIIERKLANRTNGSYSLEELDHAIELTTQNSASENEKNILKGIVKFGNITVKQIMKTRVDVHGIDQDTSFGELVAIVRDLRYSRLPVYKEDLDNVVGMIHTKDMIAYLHEPDDFNWHPLMRQPYFVHEQKFIEDLLKEFQLKRIHFAMVVDEFGGTSGIVTLEDILEEVIGEIKDEFDEEEADYKKLDEFNYIFEGRTMINDVCKIMDLPSDTFDNVKGESDSLAGLVLELAGEIPTQLQVVNAGDFEFTVLEVSKKQDTKSKGYDQATTASMKLVDSQWSIVHGRSAVVKSRFYVIIAVAMVYGLLTMISSCNSSYTPKPTGYYKIDFPLKKYQLFDQPGYPYSFEYPVYAKIVKDSTFFGDATENPWWINVDFPQFAGRIYVSYKEIGKNKFDTLIKHSFALTGKHTSKAYSIEDTAIATTNNIHGVLFTVGGDVATANQFFLTDTTKHFLRGALYFDATPNSDSLGIVNRFLLEDMKHLINTFKWKKS